jgi:hypothetical protein
MDRDLRVLLEDKAEEMRIEPRIPGPVLRRARRRRAATAVGAGIVAAGVALGAIVGIGALVERVPSSRPREAAVGGAGTPAEAVFPDTEEQIAAIQGQVAEGHTPGWTDPELTAVTFATNVLGWDMADVAADVRGDDPVTVIITNPTLNRRFSPGADIRMAVTLAEAKGQPGPQDDIYVVMSTYAEDIQLNSPQPGQPTVPGSDVVFSGRLVHVIPGAGVEASLTWEDQAGGAGAAVPPSGEAPRHFDVPLAVPQDAEGAPIAAVTIRAASGEALAQTTFRLETPTGSTMETAAPPVVALPDPVTTTREAILAAARAADWEHQLRALIPEEGFTFSFGGERDPIAYWRKLESVGHVPVIGDILPMVLGTDPGPVRGGYIWPAQAAEDPADWDQDDLAALRRIHADEDIRSFQEAGTYLGWRVEIARDGTWTAFVAGD